MPTYSVAGPEGKTYSIEGPEGATRDQIVGEILRQLQAQELETEKQELLKLH